MITHDRADHIKQLFEDHYERIFIFARNSVSSEQAEDIAQEVFFRLLHHQNLEKITVTVSYLFKIADNLIKRRYRRSQLFDRYLEKESQRHDMVRGAKAASRDQGLDPIDLTAEIDRLSPEENEAIRLIICQGLSYEHAATSLGVPVSTVNNWKYRALQKIKLSYETRAERVGDRERVENARRSGAKQETNPSPSRDGNRKRSLLDGSFSMPTPQSPAAHFETGVDGKNQNVVAEAS